MLTVQEIMTTDLSTLPISAPIQQAARIMRDEDVGDVIILDEAGAVMGMVTDRDIAIRAIADGLDPNARVGEICATDLVAARPDQDIDEVMAMMQSQSVRRIPVIDGDRAIGVISLDDLFPDR